MITPELAMPIWIYRCMIYGGLFLLGTICVVFALRIWRDQGGLPLN